MKKIVTSFLMVFAILLSNIQMSTAASGLEMRIDEDVVVKNSTKRMYGSNFEWGGEEHIYLKAASGTTETNLEFVKCFKDALPFNRMAGTSANNMYWKNAVGPLSNRKPLYSWGFTKVWPHGPIEWVRGTGMADPTGEYVVTVNLSDTAANIADFVEFMTGDPKENINGGINWAEKRVEYGIKDPVKIFSWELGNEMDLYGEDVWPVERYVEMAREKLAAIRSVDPDAKISAHAHTYATQLKSGWEKWHRTVLKEIGDELDYISVHYYYPANDVTTGGKVVDTITKDAKAITGRDDIKIIFSENACARAATSSSAGVMYRLPHTLHGVLATAEFYLRCLDRPEIVGANYHSINSSSWQICYPEAGTIKSSGILELMKLMINNMCGEVVRSTLTGYERNQIADVIGGAVKTDKGLNIAIVNRSLTEAFTVKFDFGDKMYKLNKVSTLTGDNKDVDNYNGVRGIEPEITEVNNNVPLFSYTVEPISFVILELEEIDVTAEEANKAKLDDMFAKITAVKAGESDIIVKNTFVYNSTDTKTQIINDKLYIPSKQAQTMLGGNITWNEDATEITFDFDSKIYTYSVDDENRHVIKIGSSTYIPLRSIAQDCQKEVYWDERGFAAVSDKSTVNYADYGNAIGDMINDMYAQKGRNYEN